MSVDGEPVAEVSCRIQLSGVLSKRPIGHEAARWSRRFFVVKDGFLLYYPESAQKIMGKRQCIGLHPRGILPLGGCLIQATAEPGHQFCIEISSGETTNAALLAAETELERSCWQRVLEQASRITWRNAQLGDAMIQQLERQGLDLTLDKQRIADELKAQTGESEKHERRARELEQLNEELCVENQRLERVASEIKNNFDSTSEALNSKVAEIRQAEQNLQQLESRSQQLQESLSELEEEKTAILSRLASQHRQNESLADLNNTVVAQLKQIETKMAALSSEKTQTHDCLMEQQKASQLLEVEKQRITSHAHQLEVALQELVDQKAKTDEELKRESESRREAERRLEDAKQSLHRLEQQLMLQQQQQQQQEEPGSGAQLMMSDVNTLKKYFENVIFEETVEAKKTEMIKTSLQARRALRRRCRTVLLDDRNQLQPSGSSIMRRAQYAMTSSDSNMTSPTEDQTVDELFQATARAALKDRFTCFELIRQVTALDNTSF